MLSKSEKLISYIDRLPFDKVRSAWIARCRAENGRLDALEKSMLEIGMERVDATGLVTDDGREVISVHGRSYALSAYLHTARLTKSLVEHNQGRVTQRANTREGLALITCPQMIDGKPCGGSVNHTRVCAGCVTGQMGYRHRYTCESCGFDIVTKVEVQA